MLNIIEKLGKINVPFFYTFDVCFDIGTSNTRIGIKDKGVVLSEPSYIGYNSLTKEYIFYGSEAKTILGKTPEYVKIIRPVVNGVISDFDAEVGLLTNFFNKSIDPYMQKFAFLKPPINAIACVSNISTDIEQKAVEEALRKIGISSVDLIEKPIATAFGCGVNIFYHHPHLIADLGGGLIELAIVSGGGIVSSKTLKNAGDSMNHTISNYAYLKYGIILGEATCEELKKELLNFTQDNKTLVVRGKSLENGLPKSVRIKSSDVREALLNHFIQISDTMKELIEISPPEVVDEIYTTGIILAGGLGQVKGVDVFFSNELKIDVVASSSPENATIHGLMKILQNKEYSRKLSIPKV